MEIKNDKIERRDPTNDDTTSYTYIQQAAIHTDENAHSGSDVSKPNLIITESKSVKILLQFRNFIGVSSCHWSNVTSISACS